MKSEPKVGIGVAVAVLAFAALIGVSPVYAQSEAPDQAALASSIPADSAALTATAVSPGPKKTLGQKVKALVAKITPDRIKRDIEFRKASALFPDFCKHWEQDLHDRETNNLSNLKFNEKDGYQTATYTAYGKVSGCESHQSKDGYSIGKITYEEFEYYIAGRSADEARHAAPKTVSDTHTTEIFRWDNGKWFY
ncbi:hypothetical protein [Candidatus Binatus sp.]|uniref:hypothetical protein n=1 Tax=Candidatus Binatus sp. TaxID=2811406 RepID=UPI003C939B7B